MEFIYRFLAITSPLSALFPFIVSILTYRRQSKLFKIVCLHLFIVAFFEALTHWLWLQKENNLFLLHIYTLVEFEVLSFFYFTVFKEGKKRWVIPLLMVLFVVGVLVDGFFIHGFQNFNNYARSIECLIIMSYAIYYFYKQLSEGKLKGIFREPVLLINGVFLFYFSASFFLFLFSNFITQAEFTRHLLWSMHTITAWILYTTIGIALWKAGRK